MNEPIINFPVNREPFIDREIIPPYEWHGPFCWSIRCPECRREVPHSEAVHWALSGLIKLAMDAQYTDADIVKILRDAAKALENGNFFSWSKL